MYRWQCLADLARLKRVAEEYSDLLFEAKIETVSEVARKKADEIYDDVIDAAKKAKKKRGWQGDVKKHPSEKDIQIWIESAKGIVKAGKEATASDVKAKASTAIASETPEDAQIADVIEIEGIGPEYAKDLKAVGIENTEQLRKAPLVEVVEATNISPKHVYKWICLSDLFRLKRVAEEYSDLLFYAEIETVSEVAQQKSKDLLARVKRAAEDAEKKPGWHGDVEKVPSESDVKQWIKSAKDLLK